MMAAPNPALPRFGLVTNGDEFVFVKLITTPIAHYDFSDHFSVLSRRRNQLWDVLQILKRLQTMIDAPAN